MTYNLLIHKGGDDYSYPISERDRLDLTRAVAKEGSPADAVTWSLIQRFAWLYPAYGTLSDFVRAYAQPINPRWFPDGDKHRSYIAGLKKRKASAEVIKEAEKDARNRITYAKASYSDIPEKYTELVLSVLDNKVSNPVPGGVHYIASQAPHNVSEPAARLLQEKYAANRTDLKEPLYLNSSRVGNNWFFNVDGSDNLGLHIINDGMQEVAKNIGKDDQMAFVFILYGAAVHKLKDYLEKNL